MSTLNAGMSQTMSRTNLLEAFEMRAMLSQTSMRKLNDSNEETVSSALIGSIMILVMVLILMITFPFSLYFCVIIIHDHEKAVLFRNGRLLTGSAMGPGVVFVLPMIDKYRIIDCRIACYDIPPQTVLTKDSITIDVDAVVLYRVHSAIVAVTQVENYARATEFLAATSLRNILGTKTLAQILADCLSINETLEQNLDAATDLWGVKVERIDIKNVKLPKNLQMAMSAEAQASREAKAKYIQAEGEQRASKALVEAAQVIDSSADAIQLRLLQTLNNISLKNNQTFVVPFPIELFEFAY